MRANPTALEKRIIQALPARCALEPQAHDLAVHAFSDDQLGTRIALVPKTGVAREKRRGQGRIYESGGQVTGDFRLSHGGVSSRESRGGRGRRTWRVDRMSSRRGALEWPPWTPRNCETMSHSTRS